MSKKNFLSKRLLVVILAAFIASCHFDGAAIAADEDLPLPAEESDSSTTADTAPLPDVGEPSGESGPDDLPSPSLGNETGGGDNLVNKEDDKGDDVFLPTPNSGPVDDSVFVGAPVGNSTPNYASRVEPNWQYGMNYRPSFSLDLGISRTNYDNSGVPDAKSGYAVGASYRAFELGQTIFMHLYGGFVFTKIGDITATNGTIPFQGVSHRLFRYGPIFEIGVGRRLSLFGSMLREEHYVNEGGVNPFLEAPDRKQYFKNIAVENHWKLGFGGQYDFHVVPHGSLGVRGMVEGPFDLFIVSLVVSVEPVPRKRLTF